MDLESFEISNGILGGILILVENLRRISTHNKSL